MIQPPPTTTLRHEWSQDPLTSCHAWHRYPLHSLSFISLFWCWKKNKYTHPSMTHTPMFLSNLTKLSGLNKKYQKSRISIFNELPDTEMIAKMLWALMQVNLPLIFLINEIPISSQLYKKRLYDFFECGVIAFHEIPHPLRPTHLLCLT